MKSLPVQWLSLAILAALTSKLMAAEPRADALESVTRPSAFESPGGAAESPDRFNYILGTQTIGAAYQFTDQTRLVETAEAIRALGASVIKFELKPQYFGPRGNVLQATTGIDTLTKLVRDEPSHRRVLDMPFAKIVLWVRSFVDPPWRKGLSAHNREAEYRELYDLTVHVLRTYGGTGKTFYLGHWEGDGLLRGTVAQENDARVTPTAVQGMADWLNVRQLAVDDAKRATPHEGVEVWHYTEVNHVELAMQGRPALVNEVLPKTTVDLVSYSCYDTQQDPVRLKAALDFIQAKLPPKPAISGRRVFIGEYGFPASRHTPAEQDSRSRQVIRAAIEWGCPLVLYWELYDNEVDRQGKQVGFWMIDDRGRKQPIYTTHARFYDWARGHVAERIKRTGGSPSYAEFRRAALDFLASP